MRLTETTSVTLDLIRAVSAQAVVVGHAASFFHVLPVLRPPGMPYVQDLGVVVFFLLSGYLISYTVYRKSPLPTYTFGVFAVERFARIFSGFVPGLVLILVIDLVTLALTPDAYRFADALRPDLFISNLLMLQDESFGRWLGQVTDAAGPVSALMVPFGSGRPLWTLAIEWWIYLAFGWSTLALLRRPRSPRAWLVAAAFAVIPLYNLVGGRGDGLTLTWLFGAVAFWVAARAPVQWSTTRSAIAGTLCLALAALRALQTGDAYDTALAVLLAAALYFVIATCRTTRWRWGSLPTRVVRFTAGYSMTLYIVHYSILAAVVSVVDPSVRWPAFAVGILLANGAAAVLAVAFEMRHRAFARWLLDRVPGAARRPVAGAGPATSSVKPR